MSGGEGFCPIEAGYRIVVYGVAWHTLGGVHQPNMQVSGRIAAAT